jgi:regulator of sirC expression with transglutaminase-like and TPR domain
MNVPAEDFESFLTQIETVSEFSNISSNANDVTEYVLDIDSRLKALINEKIALEEIKKEATSTSDKLQVQAQLRYINQDIEMLQGQKEYYEKSTSYSTLTLEIREGSGVSLFSWNYYVQRALSWIETIIGISISLSFVIGPLMLIYFVVKKIRNKN